MPDDVTSLRLLDKVIREADSESWNRLARIYSPLLRNWLDRYAIQASDADDLVQEVLSTVSRELPHFEHSGRPGAFRSWLRTILVHRLHDFWRSGRYRPVATGDSQFMQQLDQLADRSSELSRIWNHEHDQHVVSRILDMVQPKVAPKTWEAFRRQSIEGAAAREVAGELGISVDAVYAAKSRVLKMLRQEAEGLVD
jgi:RNA polymerase sigma-70 factor (ECF subfamily)